MQPLDMGPLKSIVKSVGGPSYPNKLRSYHSLVLDFSFLIIGSLVSLKFEI